MPDVRINQLPKRLTKGFNFDPQKPIGSGPLDPLSNPVTSALDTVRLVGGNIGDIIGTATDIVQAVPNIVQGTLGTITDVVNVVPDIVKLVDVFPVYVAPVGVPLDTLTHNDVDVL